MSESQRRVTQPRAPRLLSLDGGGVRGLSSLLILQRMMELINPNHPPKPCECFDLIGGTSTGGLIAVMLGRLRMHTSEAIDAYLKLSEDVFQPRRNQMDILARVRDRVQLRGRFDGDTLAQAVRDVVQKSGEAPEALLMEPQEGPCKVFVCSVLQEVSQPVLLRSYHSPGVASQLECKIWEACRATSAATSFFDPIRIGPFGQQFSDGATGWNNPVRQVYSEARKLWPDSKIQCLVSIGTGKPRLSAFGDDLRNIAKTLVRLATETELTAEEFLLDHADLDLAGSYFRLNVSKGLEEVGLQEYAAMSTIASATMAYLESREAFEQVTRCVHRLRAPEAKEIANDVNLSADEEKWLYSLYTADHASHRWTISRPVSGTCRWFLQHQKYISWRDADRSNLLWVSGDPGCGKSVLSSFLVDQLTANPPHGKMPASSVPVPYVTVYFFCDDKIQEHRDAPSIVRSILHQLVADRPSLVRRYFGSCFKSRGTAAAKELITLWDLFVAVCRDKECPPLVVIIDALDECEERTRSRLLSSIANLYSDRSMNSEQSSVKMLITSRPEISIADTLEALEEVRLKAEDETESISKDVVLVAKERLRATLQRFNPPAHAVQALTDRLTRQAGHTFLWVSLMLQMIERSAEASEESLSHILVDLPDGLDGVYEKILARTQGRNRQKARTILQVVVAASRPLNLAELNFAISVRMGDSTVDDLQTRLEPNLARTLQVLCGPFLKVTNSAVTLVHQTAKEFLLRIEGSEMGAATSWKHTLDPADAHLTIARACLLTLSHYYPPIYHNGGTPFAMYALKFWIIHLLECEDKLDLNLIEQTVALHAATQTSSPHGNEAVLPTSLTKGHYFPHTQLSFASLCGFRRIIEHLAEKGHAINEVDRYERAAIDYSALSGRSSAVDTLLRLGARPTPTSIDLATAERFPDVVAALLRSDNTAFVGGATGRGYMVLAVETGHEGLARLLVERGVRTDIKINEGGETPLIAAVKRGDTQLAKALIPGSLQIPDNLGRTAMHWAATHNHEAILKVLLASGARANSRCGSGETPLLKAVKGRYLGMARFLLGRGADANLTDTRGSTPLWWAVISGDEALVQLLLPVTRISDVQGPKDSLSWWARRNGHASIANILEARQPQAAPLGPPSPPADRFAYDVPVMIYVTAHVSGFGVRAMICTAASGTVMTASFARKSQLIKLVDKRFSGVAQGVGTAQIIGRIHSTQIQLGSDAGVVMPTGFTVIEYTGWPMGGDILLGLDFLKRYRCTVDFRQNRLVLPFMKTTVPMFEDLE